MSIKFYPVVRVTFETGLLMNNDSSNSLYLRSSALSVPRTFNYAR